MKLTAEQIKEYRTYMPPIEGRHDTDDCRSLILKYNYRLNRALDALEAETARANANRSEAILIDRNSAEKDREIERLSKDRDFWKSKAEALGATFISKS